MAVYIGHDECQVIYVARNGQQLRVSSIWVGDQQVFPPANRQEVHFFTRDTQGYGRVEDGTGFAFTVPVPWWAASMDVVIIGAGEKGRDGTKSFTGGSDGAGGKSGAWAVRTAALPQSTEAVVNIGKGTSTSPHATEVVLPGVGGQADVRVHDGEGTRTPNNGATGGTPSPRKRTDYGDSHLSGVGGARNTAGGHPGGGGGGGKGSNLLGNPTTGKPGGDGYVWLRFRSAPALNPGDVGFILRVGVTSGWAYNPMREWAVSIGKTYQTITEITVPMEVIGPSLYALFYNCSSLVTIPALDTSQVTNMEYMFYGCAALTSVPALNTSQVTSMSSMFYNCAALTSVPELDTSKVTNMEYMFYGCAALTSVPELDTSNVTDMRATFYECHALASVPELDTSNVTDMRSMFAGCSSLARVPALDTSQVTDMYAMFADCSSLTAVPALNTSRVTTMYAMFQKCSSLTSAPDLDTSQVTNMYAMFSGCSSLASAPDMDTSQVTDMYAMFYGCSTLTTIPALDTSQVTNMQSMFRGCSSLASAPDMDTSKVTDMYTMFANCSSLTSVPAMDTSKVTDMGYMFESCSLLTTIPELDTSQVTNMYAMFYGCSSLESVTLPGMGSAFAAKQTLYMKDTKLNAAAANALMQSLGTVPRAANGTTLQLPSTAKGADRSIATAKNWQVTIA